MKIGIIGTGAYAIALASMLENYHRITMWTKLEEEFLELEKFHTNKKVLDYRLSNEINFTMDIEKATLNMDIIIIAIPAIFLKDTIVEMRPFIKKQTILIATKGLEKNSNSFIHEFIKKELNSSKIACISGPTFAKDIILKEPIGLTLASKDKNVLEKCLTAFSPIPYLNLDTSTDILGCELCGILKNIIAILSGLLEGSKFNPSTKAKFFVMASLEIKRLITKLGGKQETFFTYAGIGDLMLTTTSSDSRNYTFGYLIGSNDNFLEYKNKTTIEGLENLISMREILKRNNITSKVIDILYKIVYLHEEKDIIIDYLKNKNQ